MLLSSVLRVHTYVEESRSPYDLGPRVDIIMLMCWVELGPMKFFG